MKLVLAVVQNQDAGPVLEKLLEKGLRATKLASTGGFLRQGNTTFLIGVENERVPEVVEILRNTCRPRQGRGQARAGSGTSTSAGAGAGAGANAGADTGTGMGTGAGAGTGAGTGALSGPETGITPCGSESAGAIVFVLNVSRFDRI